MRQCVADAESKASTAQREQKKTEDSARPLLEQRKAAQAKISGLETEVADHVKPFFVQQKSLEDIVVGTPRQCPWLMDLGLEKDESWRIRRLTNNTGHKVYPASGPRRVKTLRATRLSLDYRRLQAMEARRNLA